MTWQVSSLGPTIVSDPPRSARAGLLYKYDAAAFDADDYPVIWSLDTAPSGMSVNGRTGTVRWTPNLDQLGSALVVLRVTDTHGGFTTQGFAITVRSGNTPPNITSKPPTQAAVEPAPGQCLQCHWYPRSWRLLQTESLEREARDDADALLGVELLHAECNDSIAFVDAA